MSFQHWNTWAPTLVQSLAGSSGDSDIGSLWASPEKPALESHKALPRVFHKCYTDIKWKLNHLKITKNIIYVIEL